MHDLDLAGPEMRHQTRLVSSLTLLLRHVNSLERTPPDWYQEIAHPVDGWERHVVVPAARRYPVSPQRDFAYSPQRWVAGRATYQRPAASSRPAPPRLYRSLSYDTDRDPFLARPAFDRLPPGVVDQAAYPSPPPRLPRAAPVVPRPYADARRRYDSPALPVYLPPQKFGSPAEWMTWNPRRSPMQFNVAQAPAKCSPRHLLQDSCSLRSRSSTASVHDPTTKRVLLTPDPRRTSTLLCNRPITSTQPCIPRYIEYQLDLSVVRAGM